MARVKRRRRRCGHRHVAVGSISRERVVYHGARSRLDRVDANSHWNCAAGLSLHTGTENRIRRRNRKGSAPCTRSNRRTAGAHPPVRVAAPAWSVSAHHGRQWPGSYAWRLTPREGLGGDGRIRTVDASFCPHAPLAGECLRPLGHVSGKIPSVLNRPAPAGGRACKGAVGTAKLR